jgi:acyl-CoA reductase-like NAD-dependent aldehyde dehydrogenase
LLGIASVLYENKDSYANLIVRETGKIKVQALDEIDKCIAHLNFCIENSERFLKDEEYRLMSSQMASVLT